MEKLLEYRGIGNQQAVYDMLPPEWSDQVAKIDYASVRNLLKDNARKGRKLDEISPDWRMYYEAAVSRERQEHASLRSHFDYHAAEQYTQIATTPISCEQIKAIFTRSGEEPPLGYDAVSEVPAVVTIQEKVLFAEKEKTFSLNLGNIDIPSIGEEDIAQTKKNFQFQNSGVDYSTDIGRLYSMLQPAIEKIREDESVKQKMRDFAEKLIEYTADTGKGLDLNGQDNVVFYGDDGAWDYKLIDAMNSSKDFLKEISLFNQQKLTGGKDSRLNEAAADNVHYLRGINALAWLAGSEKRLDTIHGVDIMPYVEDVCNYVKELKQSA